MVWVKSSTRVRAGSEVTREAHLTIALGHAGGVEARAVRVHAQPDVRVASRAVPLLVTARARLHFLPRRLPMLVEPERLAVVIRDVARPARQYALPAMALTAEGLRGVTRRAVALTPRRTGRVSTHEVEAMEATPASAVVAIGARAFLVAPLAIDATTRRGGAMLLHEVEGMHPHQAQRRVGRCVGNPVHLRHGWTADKADRCNGGRRRRCRCT
jgi:hypothetical protein